MQYTCPVCKNVVEGDLKKYVDHTEEHVLDIIKGKNPHWVEKDGVCPKCLEYYKRQIKGTEP